MLQIKAAEVDQKLRLEEQASRQHQRNDIDALLLHFEDNPGDANHGEVEQLKRKKLNLMRHSANSSPKKRKISTTVLDLTADDDDKTRSTHRSLVNFILIYNYSHYVLLAIMTTTNCRTMISNDWLLGSWCLASSVVATLIVVP
jgi:hypothetical protein